jgi:hypothetical protein
MTARRTDPTVHLHAGARYRSAAATDVTLTLEQHRKRIGAPTGAQIRAARAKALRGDAVTEAPATAIPAPATNVTALCLPTPKTRKAAK